MKKSMLKILAVLGIVGGICAGASVQAAEIQGVSIYSYSSQNFAYPSTANYSVTNLVSNVGLFGDLHCFVPGGCMWLATNGANNTNYVTFNLGGVYTVNALKVWNYNDSTHLNYGVSNASISYSMDGVNFTTSIASQNFNEAPGNWHTYAQTITLPSPVTAQYVRINVNTNWGGATAGVGLSKVRFISNTNAPSVSSASENFGSNQVTVVFSESVSSSSALNAANYSITCSGAAPTILSVAPGEYADRVILHTTPLTNNNYSVSVSGVYDEALTAAVTNNSTVPVQSELYLWLRADQGVTTTSAYGGNMLTAWNDQSSYGHNAQPAAFFGVLTNQPFLAANVVNGLPAVQFFGTNVMQIPNDAANPINGDMTLFLVLSSTSSGSAEDPINKTGGGSSTTTTNNLGAPFDFYFDATAGGGKPTFYYGNDDISGVNVKPTGQISPNTFYVVALSVTATNVAQMTFDGVPAINNPGATPNPLSYFNTMTAAPWDGGNPIAIGARNSGPVSSAQPFIGYLPEVMLIRGTVTPSDFVNIENYLAAKYAIAPPSITEQPANVTANAGGQARFWAAATGEMPFSYQWQSNGVAIAGATNMSYTTPYLTASASGASYKVTISNASGNVTSSAATLTVVTPATPPTVSSAVKSAALTNILIVFSEAIDPTTGLNANNYSINGGVSVTSAAAGASANQVLLTTSLLSTNGVYELTVQNVKDLYNNAITGVSVPVMPSSVSMWLRADQGVVTNASVGSAVDAWLDQTANGNDAESYGIGSSHRPSLGTDPVNGKPAVIFNSGAQNYLVAASSPGLALSGDMTIYIVADYASYSTYLEVISKNTGGDADPYEINTLTGGSGHLRWSRGDGTSNHNGTATAGSAAPLNTPSVWGVVHQGTVNQQGGTSYFYLNGNNVTTTTFTSPEAFGDLGANLYVGTRNSFDLFMNGNIAEVMVFTNGISGADRTNVDNYLGAKYFALTNSLPLTNEMANAGNTATFVVSASQGPAHVTYQWLENGTNIPGATGPSYTTGTLLAGDNGDTFAVDAIVVGSPTNMIGPVTLTVASVAPQVTYYGTPIWDTNNLILVTFQETVNPSSATNTANYILNNGASVLSATMWSPTQVLLTTSPLNNPPYQLTVENVQSEFGAPMTTANLSNVSGNLYPQNVALWLRADAGISAPPGGAVAEWDDQSGNGNNFYNGTAGYQPVLVADALNGYPALFFNATNETYLYAAGSPSLAITNNMAIFAVMNFATYANPGGIFGVDGGGEIISKTDPTSTGVPAPYDYYVYYNSPNVPYFLRGDGQVGNGSFVGAQNSPSTGEWHELSVMMNANTMYHRLDGRQNGTVTWTGTIADTGGYAFIGSRADGNVRLTGEMAELLVVGSSLSTNDETAIETYMGTKYGLIASPGLLGISLSNTNTLVSWEAPQWSFVLQSSPTLNPTIWTTVTNPVVLVNNTNVVTIPASTNQMYYRLKSQSQ